MSPAVHATCVEDLQVYQRAVRFAAAVFAITPRFRLDSRLAGQSNDSAESVMSNIAEGFRQPTDRAFARYLEISASSAEESRSHLVAAALASEAQAESCRELAGEAREIANMLGAFIRYLRRCDRKSRTIW